MEQLLKNMANQTTLVCSDAGDGLDPEAAKKAVSAFSRLSDWIREQIIREHPSFGA